MTERYQEFDHNEKTMPFVSLENFIKRFCRKPTRTEAVLGILTLVSITVCIILAVYVTTSQYKNQHDSTIQTGSLQGKTPCLSMGCLRGAAFAIANQNSNVKPCDDFYQYACGSFKSLALLQGETVSKTAKDLIFKSNKDKIQRIIEEPYNRNKNGSIRRKVKDYYVSCISTYSKEKAKGFPFLINIIPNLGGWSVLSNWTSRGWNFQRAFLNASRDYSVLAFFRFIVAVDRYHRDKRVIEIGNIGLTMKSENYLSDDRKKIQDALKTYMRASARLYARDSYSSEFGTPEMDARIETFVKDAYDMEYRLAKIGDKHVKEKKGIQTDFQAPSKRVGLVEVNHVLGSAIDVASLLKLMFGEKLKNDDKIVIQKPEVLKNVFHVIRGLGPSKNRMLNNYLVWRAMDRYNHDLSSEYLHLKRQFYVDRRNDKLFSRLPTYCLQTIESHFGRAMGAMFIQDHFADKNKEEVKDLVKFVKEEVISSVSASRMYDEETKVRAIKKINAIHYNVGYPDYMMKNDVMDAFYEPLKISASDYFQNVLNANRFTMKKFSDLLDKSVKDDDTWIYQTYSVNITFDYIWNVLDIPAGLLQFPVYNQYLPHYIRYGTIGVPLAIKLVHAIDIIGGHYDDNGNLRVWWTNSTHQTWDKQIKCMEKYFMDQSVGPYKIPGQSDPVSVRIHPHFAAEGMSDISGIRLAFKAYERWTRKYGREKPYPGLSLNNEQLFFLAYAQTICFKRNPVDSYQRTMKGIVSEDTRLNAVLPYVDEFVSAYGCSANSMMSTKKQCNVFS